MTMKEELDTAAVIKRATGMTREDTLKRLGEACRRYEDVGAKKPQFTAAEYETMLTETLEENSRLLEENERLQRESEEREQLRQDPLSEEEE